MKKQPNPDSTSRRQKAEALLKKKTPKVCSEADTLKLIHELEVHQIELELINDELKLSKEQADEAANKYIDLYDFAPSAYFTLTRDGKILKLNLYGSQLLGKDRSHLIDTAFGFYISQDSKLILHKFLENIFKSKKRQKCIVWLIAESNLSICLNLSGIINSNEKECSVTAVDITEQIQAKEELEEKSISLRSELDQRIKAEKKQEEVYKRLEESRFASLNLLEDLQNEINERKHSEILLKESEEKFSVAFKTAPYAIMLTEADTGKIIEVNDVFYKMAGYNSKETSGNSTIEMNLWNDTADRDFVVSELKAGRKVLGQEFKFKKSNNEIIIGLFSAQIVHLKEKPYILSSINDITERKQAELALFESEKKYRLITEKISDVVWLMNLNGKSIFVSPSIEKFTGYTVDEYLAQTMNNRFTPESAAIALETFKNEVYYYTHSAVQPSDYKKMLSLDYRCKNGSIKTGEILITPYFDDHNNCIGLHGVTRDITVRKQTEDALKQSEAMLKEAMQIARLGAWSYDVKNDQFTFNDQFYSLFHTTAEREGGYVMSSEDYARKFVHPDDFAMVGAEIKKCLETTDPDYCSQLDHRIIYSNGEIGHLAVHIRIEKDAHGNTVTEHGVNQDITDRRKAELEVVESENKFRAIFENNSSAIAIMNRDTTIAMVNEAYCQASGYSHEEVIGKSWTTQIPPDDLENIIKYNRRRLINPDDAPDKYEIKFYHKNGTVKHGLMSVSMMQRNGNIITSFIDITERKLVENTQNFLLHCGNPGSGEDFFYALARHLALCLNMDYVCIDQLEGDGLTAQTLAVYNEGTYVENFSYVLKDTLRVDVVGKLICCFPENVCRLFPNDDALQMLKAESYIGTTLWSFDGKPIGFIAVIGQKPLENLQLAEAILKIVSVRASGELERKKVEDELAKNHDLLFKLSEKVPGVIYQYRLYADGSSCFPYSSSGMMDIYGYSSDDVRKDATPVFGRIHTDDVEMVSQLIFESARTLGHFSCEFRVILPGQGLRWHYSDASPERMEDNSTLWHGIIYDITDRKIAEEHIKVLSRIYALLSNINQTIVHTRDKQTLFDEACRIAVDDGGFLMAWIGIVNTATNTVDVVASSGNAKAYLNDININLNDELRSSGPTGRAIKSGKSSFSNNIETDDKMIPWRKKAAIFGFKSSITLPIIVSGNNIGAFTMYTRESNYFNDEEIKLLDEMASDISFALEFIENELEREQAEKALNENNVRLNLAMQVANMAWWEMDLSTGNIVFEKKKAEMLGFPHEMFKHYNDFMALVHPEDYNRTMKAMKEHLDGKLDKYEIEYRILTHTNTYKWFYDIGSVVKKDIKGKPLSVTGLVIDITDRKIVQEALQSSKDYLDKIINTVASPIFVKDIEHKFTLVNDALCVLLSTPANELIGRTGFEHFPDDQNDVFFAKDKEVFTTGKVNINEEFITDGTGKIRTIITTKVLFTDSSGNKFLVGVINDITERNAAEKVLNDLIEMNPMSIQIVDMDGFTIKANPVHTLLFGNLPPSDFSIFTDLQNKGFGEHILLAKKGEVIHFPDIYYNVHDVLPDEPDNPLWIRAVLFPLTDPAGIPEKFVFMHQDITKRKQAEVELIKAKEKAEESDRLKSNFLANMSHEIRTPMNGILGFTELLKEQNLTGKQQNEFIATIEKSGERLLNIINDIINISKAESNTLDILISSIDINEQIDFLIKFFRPEADKKGLQLIHYKALSSQRAIIRTDREKLYAILTNLVKNALKFTKTGFIEIGYNLKPVGTVGAVDPVDPVDPVDTVGAVGELVEPVEPVEPVELVFYVKDTGIGIQEAQKEIVFERFRQVSEGLSRSHEGAGLGLSISKAYVEMLGGKIWVESDPNSPDSYRDRNGKLHGKAGGSTFFFSLPYICSSNDISVFDNALTDQKERKQLSKLKVLIAEDDEGSKKLINIIVNKFSQEIINVQNGVEAVAACHNNPDIDLILMDIQMPLMNGYEATRKIREFNNTVTIIAQTAFAMAGDKKKAIEAGCDEYISKPINIKTLGSLIEKYFGNK